MPKRVLTIMLCVYLALGSITPLVEFYRGLYRVTTLGIEEAQPDMGTLEGSDFSVFNFGTDSPQDTVFYKYFAK